MTALDGMRERALAPYRDQIGRARHEVTSPALLLDLDAAKRNIATMARKFDALPTRLRPHIKVHKSIELSRLTVAAGAVGVACATVWEAAAMARGGIDDVLVANQVTQPDKIAVLAELARDHRITIAVDAAENVEQLGRAVARSGSSLEILIEVDVGMGRCGVRELEDLLPIAETIDAAEALSLRGIQAYEGHCMLEPDRDLRVQLAGEANARAVDAADFLLAHGFACPDISGGGTGTYYITGANPRFTEVQAGSYALLDCFHDNLIPGGFEVALTVLGSVVSRQGNTIVLDCGRKSVGIDFVTPPLVAHPEAEVRYYAEEHCLVDFPGAPPLGLGDTAEVMAGYGPTTVNLHAAFHVIQDDVVVDIWPVNPRGAGPPIFT